MRLHNFHRSSASYRVRIALALKGIDYEYVPVKLAWDPAEAEHTRDTYRERNPQMLVPFLEDGDLGIGQTLAILDYLDRKVPEPPLYPTDPAGRARVLSIASYICSEIQPLPSLRVEQHLHTALGLDMAQLSAWRQHWIRVGFTAVERMLTDGGAGRFCHGDAPTAADCFLVPQAYNARRAKVDLDEFPTIARVVGACLEHPAFADTVAEKMPDHEPLIHH